MDILSEFYIISMVIVLEEKTIVLNMFSFRIYWKELVLFWRATFMLCLCYNLFQIMDYYKM